MRGAKPAPLAGAPQHRRAGAVRRADDPRVAGEVGEAQVALVRQRVLGREREVERVVEQVHALDRAVARASGRRRASNDSASSSSPLLSCGSASSGSASASDSSTAGWRCLNVAIASGISVAPADSNEAIRRRPPRRPAIASSSASASARLPRIASVWRTSARPASVSRMPRTLRSTSVVPASRSSAAICCETADCVNESASAAAENEPWCATSRRTRMRRTSSISAAYTGPLERSFELMGGRQIGIHSLPRRFRTSMASTSLRTATAPLRRRAKPAGLQAAPAARAPRRGRRGHPRRARARDGPSTRPFRRTAHLVALLGCTRAA